MSYIRDEIEDFITEEDNEPVQITMKYVWVGQKKLIIIIQNKDF